MRRDFNHPILNLVGQPLLSENGELACLATVAINALLATFEDERSLPGVEKAQRMQLALKITANPREVEVSAEQLAKIKELIGKAFPPLIVGRAYELLETDLSIVRSNPA